MKIRKGFVSNSSSSSFVCDICNTSEAGYDQGARELGMGQCENGHTWCESHFVFTDDLKDRLVARFKTTEGISEEDVAEFITQWDEEDPKDEDAVLSILEGFGPFEEARSEVPEEMCPICNMSNITDDYIVKYVDKFVMPKKQIIADMRSKASNYAELNTLVNK